VETFRKVHGFGAREFRNKSTSGSEGLPLGFWSAVVRGGEITGGRALSSPPRNFGGANC